MRASASDESLEGRSRISAVHVVLATASLGAAGIHFAVVRDHFEEYVPFGVFFAVVAWLQALWAVGLILRPRRVLLVSGLVGNLVVVAVWAASRTTGLPMGPESGVAEAASFIDVLSTVLEIAIAVGCAVLLMRRSVAPIRGRVGWVAAALAVLLVASLTSVAIASGSGHDDETGHASELEEGQEGASYDHLVDATRDA